MAPVSSSRTTSMIVPSRSKMAIGVTSTLSHFVAASLQLGVAHEKVPHDRAEALGVRRHALGRDGRDDDAGVGDAAS